MQRGRVQLVPRIKEREDASASKWWFKVQLGWKVQVSIFSE
jgi:hypothetical protein